MMLSLSFILSPIYNSPSLLKFYSYSDGNIMIVIKMVPYPAVMLWAVSFYKFPSLRVLIILPFFALCSLWWHPLSSSLVSFSLLHSPSSSHPLLHPFKVLSATFFISYIIILCCWWFCLRYPPNFISHYQKLEALSYFCHIKFHYDIFALLSSLR